MPSNPLPLHSSIFAADVVNTGSPEPEREFVRAVVASGLRVAQSSGLVLRTWISGEVSSSCLLAVIANCLDQGGSTVFYMPELVSDTPAPKWLVHWATLVVNTSDDIEKLIRGVSWDDISMHLFFAVFDPKMSDVCRSLEWHDCRKQASISDDCVFAVVHEDCEECSLFGQGKVASLLREALVGHSPDK